MTTIQTFVLGTLFGVALTTFLAFKVKEIQPGCAISLDKMNVFFTGVDNPVSIVARGIPEDSVIITSKNLTLEKTGTDKYIVRASVPGEGSITVSGGEMPPQTFIYRVKRIPDPRPVLGRFRSTVFGNGQFKTVGGLNCFMDCCDFDFDFICNVTSFNMTYWPKNQDPVKVKNIGARWNTYAQELINRAMPGDKYFFEEIHARCPGDAYDRDIGSLGVLIR